MEKLNWKKLKDFKCPKCEGVLETDFKGRRHFCRSCKFAIGLDKFNKIVGTSPKEVGNFRRMEREEQENMERLNNL